MNADTIRTLIEQGLPGARADVRGDDGVHFEATVVCRGVSRQAAAGPPPPGLRHLGRRMGGEIHALALKTLTPEEAAA